MAKALLRVKQEPGNRKGKKRKRSSSGSRPRADPAGQDCFSFSKGYGPCSGAKAGGPEKCKSQKKRQHKSHVCGGPHSAKEDGRKALEAGFRVSRWKLLNQCKKMAQAAREEEVRPPRAARLPSCAW